VISIIGETPDASHLEPLPTEELRVRGLLISSQADSSMDFGRCWFYSGGVILLQIAGRPPSRVHKLVFLGNFYGFP
jgi:hypothetical protein